MIRVDSMGLSNAFSLSPDDLYPIAFSYTNTMASLPLLSVTWRVIGSQFNAVDPDSMLTNINGDYYATIKWDADEVIALRGLKLWSVTSAVSNGVQTLQAEFCHPLTFLSIVDGRSLSLNAGSGPAVCASMLSQASAKIERPVFDGIDTNALPPKQVTPPPRDQLASSIWHDIMLQLGLYMYAPEDSENAVGVPINTIAQFSDAQLYPFEVVDLQVKHEVRAPRRIDVQGGLSRVKYSLIERWSNVAPNALACAARTVNATTYTGSDLGAEGLAFDVWLKTNATASAMRVSIPRGCKRMTNTALTIGKTYLLEGIAALLYSITCTETRINLQFIQVG